MEEFAEPESEPVASALVLFYGGLTAVIFLSLLLTIRSLGQRPIVTFKSDSSPGEWVSLKSPDSSFTIDIPAIWEWQFQEHNQANSSFTEMVENNGKILIAIMPWADLVPDLEYLLVAQNGSSLLVVARSERLNRLSPAQAVTSLQEERFDDIAVTESHLIQAAPGDEKAVFSLKHLNFPLQCNQYLVPGSAGTFVAAVCVSTEDYDKQRTQFTAVLDSFSARSR